MVGKEATAWLVRRPRGTGSWGSFAAWGYEVWGYGVWGIGMASHMRGQRGVGGCRTVCQTVRQMMCQMGCQTVRYREASQRRSNGVDLHKLQGRQGAGRGEGGGC